VIALAVSIAALASRRNSVTFDEPFLVASGARGVMTGDFSMGWDQGPVMLYLYGTAARVAGVRLPAETDSRPWAANNRYNYGREVFFRENDPERIAFAARIVALFVAGALGVAVAVFAWRRAGPLAALLSAGVFMFLPDLLAHAGIAYHDVPMALFFFLGLWAVDEAVRNPTALRATIGGAVAGIALGVKFSALALGPAAAVIIVAEAVSRGRDREWGKRVALLLPLALVAMWAVLVLLYRGDVTLSVLREGVASQVAYSKSGNGVPAVLFASARGVCTPATPCETGVWYFFPVALMLKTPAALHLLAAVAVLGIAGRRRWGREVLRSPLRVLGIGVLVYLAILMRARLNIGVRYALPLLPLLALLVGIGLARVWEAGARRVRFGIAVLLIGYVSSSLAYYPWFLTYLNEYIPNRRDAGYRVMVDSNLDWGQGLLALRDFMREEGIDGVYLSYFGSALPEGYGIKYVPAPSWLRLPAQPPLPNAPRWIVISATTLSGNYLATDAFRPFRDRTPDRVIAQSMFAFRLE